MASWLNTSARVLHSSRLPPKATRDQAIAMLHDHTFFLQCDPHLSTFDVLTPSSPPEVPSTVQPANPTKCYTVTDIVHTIPAGLWDSKVVSTYEVTDTRAGLFVRIKSPLSIVMDTVWEIQEVEGSADEAGVLELVEDIEIRCSRLLVGVVKSQCEGGWEKIHAKMLGRLEDEVKAGEGQFTLSWTEVLASDYLNDALKNWNLT
ncbi:hypothetical protein V8F33_008443 [Rhypophila sp. PSN 637]